jgi:large subunit ribosomal protein L15e
MGLYKYIRELWKKPKENLGDLWKERLIQWRREPATVRLERPTRLDRARSLGYKPKQGFIVVRQRVARGGRQRPTIRAGRRSKHFGRRKDLGMSYQWVAEMRASKKYPNCEVLNSYYVGEDGKYYWYEVILIDRAHPQILADDNLANLAKKRGRAERGLTSASRKSRGLRHKGKGAEKIRPSLRAHGRRGK